MHTAVQGARDGVSTQELAISCGRRQPTAAAAAAAAEVVAASWHPKAPIKTTDEVLAALSHPTPNLFMPGHKPTAIAVRLPGVALATRLHACVIKELKAGVQTHCRRGQWRGVSQQVLPGPH